MFSQFSKPLPFDFLILLTFEYSSLNSDFFLIKIYTLLRWEKAFKIFQSKYIQFYMYEWVLWWCFSLFVFFCAEDFSQCSQLLVWDSFGPGTSPGRLQSFRWHTMGFCLFVIICWCLSSFVCWCWWPYTWAKHPWQVVCGMFFLSDWYWNILDKDCLALMMANKSSKILWRSGEFRMMESTVAQKTCDEFLVSCCRMGTSISSWQIMSNNGLVPTWIWIN